MKTEGYPNQYYSTSNFALTNPPHPNPIPTTTFPKLSSFVHIALDLPSCSLLATCTLIYEVRVANVSMPCLCTSQILALKNTPQLPLMVTVALLLKKSELQPWGRFRQAYTPWW